MIRPIAYKVWINDLSEGKFLKEDGPGYVLIKDKNVSRVSLIATIIRAYKSDDGNYYSIVIDDGFGSIRIKSWGDDTKLISEFEQGDLILFIGKVREYNNEIYLTPEIVRKTEANWEILRKLELIKEYGKPSTKVKEVVQEVTYEEPVEESNESIRQKILESIESMDNGEGVSVGEVSRDMNHEKVMLMINELLREGEIFEIKGRLKIV